MIHEQNGVLGRANRLLGPVGAGDRHRLSRHFRGQSAARRQDDAYRQPGPAGGGRGGGDALSGSRPGRSASLPSAAARARASWRMWCRRRSSSCRWRCGRGSRSSSRRGRRTSGASAPPMSAWASPPRSSRSSATCRAGWRQSHLVVARSGASTVAELAAIGRPAILVPLPHALDQDQRANARILEEAGGAIMFEQRAIHAGPRRRARSPGLPPIRQRSPPWRPRPAAAASSTPPTGSPTSSPRWQASRRRRDRLDGCVTPRRCRRAACRRRRLRTSARRLPRLALRRWRKPAGSRPHRRSAMSRSGESRTFRRASSRHPG